jgi:2-polyprenyl-3-methyl-5-hydroxy-6-metoxy-1,4-benzoquinol methylase
MIASPGDSLREGERAGAFGHDWKPTPVDRFGQWLSAIRVRRALHGVAGKALCDVGCGYHADLVRSMLDEAASVTLVDLAISPALKSHPRVRALEGTLPAVLEQIPTASLDAVICNNVLEHLWEPEHALRHVRRALSSGGTAFVNVPSWRGRFFLETAAFRLKVVPASEMDDHKRYYSANELWALLVRGGFRPSEIVACKAHKFGLNIFAECKASR